MIFFAFMLPRWRDVLVRIMNPRKCAVPAQDIPFRCVETTFGVGASSFCLLFPFSFMLKTVPPLHYIFNQCYCWFISAFHYYDSYIRKIKHIRFVLRAMNFSRYKSLIIKVYKQFEALLLDQSNKRPMIIILYVSVINIST